MKITGAPARVRMAEARLASAERALIVSTRLWRWRFKRHRGALIVGGGFVSGLVLTFFPPRWWARVGAFAGATAATAARSALTPAIVGTLLAHFRRADDSDRTASHPSE